ncbi:MAG: trypsin-like serine protease [Deltaproteobacteria bacterium]|nr:trypsin-like serine protease [Deltaproteobacteria bacterium]
MMSLRHSGATLLLAISLLSGCSDRSTPSDAKVIGGTPADAATLPVVALIKPDSEGILYSFCTGTLLTPTLVLTAAHCSVDSKDREYDPSTLGVVVGKSQPEKAIAARISVQRLVVHPQFQRSRMGKDADGAVRLKEAYDIAVWQLATPAADAVLGTVLAQESVASALKDGTKVVLAGYGQKSAWDSPWTAHELATAETPFNALYKQKTSVLKVDDHGRSIRKSEIIEIPALVATEFYAGAAGAPDTCKGDSGGPVFVPDTQGALRVVGVTSRGSGTCEVGGVYTLAPAFIDWLTPIAAGALKVAP